MYEQVAKDKVQESLKQGVASQQTHRAIARPKSGFSFSARIASWFASHSISKRPRSQDDRIRESERISLKTSEKTS